MQSWGHASRFDRRTTGLHPTRSGVFGLIFAAMGIDKYDSNEQKHINSFNDLRFTCVSLGKSDRRGNDLPMRRLEDYQTVTGIRRASGKVADEATVQTYRHYLLDARFGVLIQGQAPLLEEISYALRDPKWGIWFGRKSCLPASPVLAGGPGTFQEVWVKLLLCVGLPEEMVIEDFDHILETCPDDPVADMIEDNPVAYGGPIGNRHEVRWIRRVPKSFKQPPNY